MEEKKIEENHVEEESQDNTDILNWADVPIGDTPIDVDITNETDWKELGIESVESLAPNSVIVIDEATPKKAKKVKMSVEVLREKKRISAHENYYNRGGKEQKHNYYLENKEKINSRAVSPETKEKRRLYMKEYMKTYYQKFPDKVKTHVHKYSAKKRQEEKELKEKEKENENQQSNT